MNFGVVVVAMTNIQAISDILADLLLRQEEYHQEVETLSAEHDEFNELVALYPVLGDIIDECAEDVLKDYIQFKGRLSAVERIIDRIREDDAS